MGDSTASKNGKELVNRIIIACAAILIVEVIRRIGNGFISTEHFLSGAEALNHVRSLVVLHAVSAVVIALSFILTAGGIIDVAHKNNAFGYPRLFFWTIMRMFFIAASYLGMAVITWFPAYWLIAGLNLVSAVVCAVSVYVLWTDKNKLMGLKTAEEYGVEQDAILGRLRELEEKLKEKQ